MLSTRRIAWSALLAVVLQLPAGTAVFTETPTMPKTVTRSHAAAAYGNLPLRFEANQGQIDDHLVQFLSRGSDYSLQLTATEARLTVAQPRDATGRSATAVVRMTLVGTSSNPNVIGRDEVPTKSHYFMGSDPTKWQTDIPNYAKVEYQEVYPGVDLVYYGNQRRLEYDFVVSPGTDPQVIRLDFDGVDQLDVDDHGDLVLRVGSGAIRQRRPVAYQDIDGVRTEITSGYRVDGQQVGFQVGDYDPRWPLTIDPVLVYSMNLTDETMNLSCGPMALPCQALDRGLDIAVDEAGSAYVTGRVCCGDNAFVAKVSPEGTRLDWVSILVGGSNPFGEDSGRIAVDNAGDVYVVGTTADPNFPTTENAYERVFQGGSLDAYVAKLRGTTGDHLIYSTFLGGIGDDVGRGIALNPVPDSCCTVFVTGATTSTDFPTTADPMTAQPWQWSNSGATDAFVTAVNPAGMGADDLIYSTYLGGSGNEIAHSIAVDVVGTVHITGETTSFDFPTHDDAGFGSGGIDAFVSVLSVTDNDPLVFSHPILAWFCGGGCNDAEVVGTGIATDFHGNSYVTGWTTFTPWEGTFDAFPDNFGGIDAWVLKLNGYSREIDYLKTFGGGGTDRGLDIAVDPFCWVPCEAHLTGVTDGSFPIVDGFADAGQSEGQGLPDVFVARVNDAGDALIYSTYLNVNPGATAQLTGGEGLELWGPAIALEFGAFDPNEPTPLPRSSPNAYVTGGADGAFVAKLDPTPPPELVANAGPDQTVEATSSTSATVTFDGTASINPHPDDGELAYIWTVCDQPQQGEDDLRPCQDVWSWGDFHGQIATWELPIGTWEVELFVAELADPDPLNNNDTDRVLITVTRRGHNGFPVADAGPDQTCILQEGEGETCQVTLDGSGSSDPDGDPLRYDWAYTGQTLILTEVAPVVSLSAAGSPHTITLDVYDDFDPADDPSSDTVDVIVEVNHAPVLVPDALLPEMVIPCVGPDGENVMFDASAVFFDPDGDALTFTWEVKLGDNVVHSETGVDLDLDVLLHPGIYQVTLTANDLRGGSNSAGGLVEIQADEPPTLSLSLSPDTINANNHKMVAITAMITVADACDPAPSLKLLSVTSSDPDNGTGDADTPNDIQDANVGTDDREFSVRAERGGNVGERVYTVTYEASDALGNATEASATVTVPHDQSGS